LRSWAPIRSGDISWMDRCQPNAWSKRTGNFFCSFHFDPVPIRPPGLWPSFRTVPKTNRFHCCCWASWTNSQCPVTNPCESLPGEGTKGGWSEPENH
jgi:hypothetical protein